MKTSDKARAGQAWSRNITTKLQAKAKLKNIHLKRYNKDETISVFLTSCGCMTVMNITEKENWMPKIVIRRTPI